MKEEIYDLIIVGGGPGGLTAGIYSMRAALKTVLIEKGMFGGQVAITKGVENYPGFIEIGGFELCDKFLQHAKWYGLEMIQQEALAVEPGLEFHSVRLGGGQVVHAHAVILAVVLEDTKTGRQKELSTEGVFIFVWFSPNSQLVPAGIKVSPSGYVITDEKCETSIPGIFAIGDLRQKYANQIVIAAADGCTAALATAHYVEKQKVSAVCSRVPA